MNARAGFTLAELLIAGTLALLVMAGLAAVVDPGRSTMRVQAAATDIRQRLRAASEALSADLRAAGSGPPSGVFGSALGTVAPAVFPFRLGPRGDAAGTARPDALSIVTATGVGAAAALSDDFVPASGTAQVAPAPGCPPGDASCGLRPGMPVVVIDGRGQSDLFNIIAVADGAISLEPRGPISGRPFPRGSLVVPVAVSCYYLRQGAAADGLQLMAGDADQSDLPFIDHVAALTVELFGDPIPPRLTPVGPSSRAVTYGPRPPPPEEDDSPGPVAGGRELHVRDGWRAAAEPDAVDPGAGRRGSRAVDHRRAHRRAMVPGRNRAQPLRRRSPPRSGRAGDDSGRGLVGRD